MKDGWSVKKLVEVCEINYGTRVVQKKDGGTIYPVYGGGGATFKMDIYNREDCLVVSRFAMSSQCVRYVRGKFFLNDSGLTVKTDNVCLSQEYLDKCILSLNDKIYSLGKGVAQKNLDMKEFRNLNIHYPISLPEQSRIVEELDLLSNIIEKKRQQLSELDNLAQSIFYDMFGDPVTNEKGWEVKKLGDIGKIASGGTPSRSVSEYFLGNINWYSAGELNTLYLSDSIEKITEKALLESAAKIFPKGSLMIGMYDTAAFKLGILKKDSASNQACANITLYKDCVVWLYYTLKLMRDEALKYRHGARQKNLNVGFIKAFLVPLPPLSLQQLFAEKIEAIEKQKALIKQSIAETEELFNSRMDYYFS